jgi:DNA-binding protein HU-beta
VPNKAQFVELLAERLDGDKKKAQAALDAVIDTIYQAVSKGERVVLTGFGVFEKRNRAARTARNPATGATVKVKKTSVPAFKAGAEFKAITSGAKKLTRPAKKAVAAAKKAVAQATPTRAPAKKTAAKKAPAKTAAKKTTAKKTAAKKAPAKTAAKKTTAKKTAAKKTAR